jgi:diaminopimelate decarboxylase
MDEDGFLYFVGRRDSMIKSSGFRVSPTEIEDALFKTGKIRGAAVIGIPDEILGQSIKAFVVARDGERIGAAQLISECAERLPRYMLPKTIEDMDRANQLIDRWFRRIGGELHIGDAKIQDLAAAYGTPLFVYDRATAEKKWEQLRATLPARFSISYSVKANPNPAILRIFLEKGCGLEIASAGEFHQALAAGCPPQNILFAGPGKTETELEHVLARDVGEIHAESIREIDRINLISQRLGRRARVAVRINPGTDAEGGAMRMGGKPAPFGIDEEQLEEAVGRIMSHPSLEFRGVHLFTGTQILDSTVLLTQYAKAIELARRAATASGRPLDRVDFGGGLGVPYFAHEQELDIAKVRHGLRKLIEIVDGSSEFQGTEFLVEPGRFLIAESGVYVVKVNDVKVSRGKKFVIVDGGMNHNLAASGNLGQTIKRNYPIAVLNKLGAPVEETVDVVGPLCTPLDVLGRSVRLPRVEEGDLIGVFQSGAYARSASPLGFLSHPTPPEVLVNGARHSLIRRRGDLSDPLRDCVFHAQCEAKLP